MTKERFIEIILMPSVPMDAWFEFYRDRGGRIADFDRFEFVFSTILWNESETMGSDGQMKRVTLRSAYENFCDYYKVKFGLYGEA